MNRKDLLANGANLAPMALLAACSGEAATRLITPALSPSATGNGTLLSARPSLLLPDGSLDDDAIDDYKHRGRHGPFYQIGKDLWLEIIPPRWTKGQGLVFAWKTRDPFSCCNRKVVGGMTCVGGIKEIRGLPHTYVKMGIWYESFKASETFLNDVAHREKWWSHHLVKIWDRWYMQIERDRHVQTFYADEGKTQKLGRMVNTPDPGDPLAGTWTLTVGHHTARHHYNWGADGANVAPQPELSAECWQAISSALSGLSAAVAFAVIPGIGTVVAIVGVLISMGACEAACQAVAQACQ